MTNQLMQFWRRLLFYLRRDEFDRELAEEMKFHLELKTEENLAAGMSLPDAQSAAHRQFGNQTLLQEVSREMWGVRSLETLWQDLRYGVRTLRKSPGFTTVAVLSLALGIGANTAIFSVVNAVLLKPLPYDEPDRLIQVWGTNTQAGINTSVVSVPNFIDWQNQNQSFEHLAAYTFSAFTLTGKDEPEQIRSGKVSASLFDLLRVKPIIGRGFLREEDKHGGERVVVVSHGLWQRRFGADPDLVGQTLTLNNQSYTVVGIMPERFDFPGEVEMWTPNAFDFGEFMSQRGTRYLRIIARLKPGISLQQAQAEMDTIAGRLAQQYPDTNGLQGVNLVPLHEATVGRARPTLLILFSAVGFVLLIASSNVANLLLARATLRHKEIAIRGALGASRLRVIRQLITESVLLAGLGGVAGLLLAVWSLELLVSAIPDNVPRVKEIGVDGSVLGWTFLVSMLTGLIFGLAPALGASKPDLNESLKETGKSITADPRHNRVRSLLVISEVALSLVLLISAGLMINSFWRLQQVKTGFSPENVLAVTLSLPSYKYPKKEQQAAFFKEALERIENLPGVSSAGVTTILPLSGSMSAANFQIAGRPPLEKEPQTDLRSISPNYLHTMRIPLLRGRFFTERDTQDAPAVCIINETLARRFLAGEDPLGQHIELGKSYQIVGVVGDVRHSKLDAETGPEMYRPYLQSPSPSVTIVARSSASDVTSLAAAVRNEIRAIDKDQLIYSLETMEQVRAKSVAPQRFNTLLLTIFAGVSLILAAVGIYGVMAYSVTQRTQEIGIRIALGAQTGDVLKLIVKQGMMLALVGVAIGLIAAFTFTRVLTSLLYGVSATDPMTYVAVTSLLTVVAVLACYIPARRATKVDPMVALRYE